MYARSELGNNGRFGFLRREQTERQEYFSCNCKAALFTGVIFQGETWHALINTVKFMHKRAQPRSVGRLKNCALRNCRCGRFSFP